MIYRLTAVAAFAAFLAVSCSHGDSPDHSHNGENAAASVNAHDHDHAQDHDHKHEHGEIHAQDHDNDDTHAHTTENAHDVHDHDIAETADPHDGHDHADGEGLAPADEAWEALVQLATAKVEYRHLDIVVTVPGRIVPNRNKVAEISPFIESSVNRVFVEIGDRVREGDVLVCLTSPDVGMLRAEYDRAKAEAEIAAVALDRQRKLFAEEIIPRKTLEEAELKDRVARVDVEYAMKKLLALGIGPGEIDNAPSGHSEAVGSTIHVTAPLSGVITLKDAHIGRKVGPGDRLFEIIDLSDVWLEADVFEKDLSLVKTGRIVRVSVSAWPGETFTGVISHVGDVLNESTRTVRILAAIDNREGRLKPGMYADTGIVVGEKENALVVPRESVLDDENLKIVFVREPAGYHRHVVRTGISDGPYIEIIDGLSAGDIVVTRGAYQLKSRARMATVDPHAGHNH